MSVSAENNTEFRKWCESEEGIGCLSGSAEGEYLANRLWRAFHAGMHAVKKAVEEVR